MNATAEKHYPLIHIATGKRYVVAYEAGGMVELHPISGPALYRPAAELKDGNIWRQV